MLEPFKWRLKTLNPEIYLFLYSVILTEYVGIEARVCVCASVCLSVCVCHLYSPNE